MASVSVVALATVPGTAASAALDAEVSVEPLSAVSPFPAPGGPLCPVEPVVLEEPDASADLAAWR